MLVTHGVPDSYLITVSKVCTHVCCLLALVMKYIGYYAELPINLPGIIEDKIATGMKLDTCKQGEGKCRGKLVKGQGDG